MDNLKISSSRFFSRNRISIRINNKNKRIDKDKDKEILMIELYDIFENILSIIHKEREIRINIQSDIF
jgi:hypothetical protein